MNKRKRKSLQKDKKKYSSILVFLLTILIVLSIFVIVRSSEQPQNIPIEASESEVIESVKSDLKDKPLSSVCSDYGAQVISPFSNCPEGKQRLSQNQENPLFYCCR